MNNIKHLAILSAMPEEVGEILTHLIDLEVKNFGDLTIYSGRYQNKSKTLIKISVAWSGWGKVSAARAATRIISTSNSETPIDLILFTGVAGSATVEFNQWDVLVAKKVFQHDMDASPIFERFVIPAIKEKYLVSNDQLTNWCITTLIENKNTNDLKKFKKISLGVVGTGDKFVNQIRDLNSIKESTPEIKAVEMEGAAVAQVAHQEEIKWLIIRVISDSADNSASQIFSEFVNEYKNFSWQLIKVLIENLEALNT